MTEKTLKILRLALHKGTPSNEAYAALDKARAALSPELIEQLLDPAKYDLTTDSEGSIYTSTISNVPHTWFVDVFRFFNDWSDKEGIRLELRLLPSTSNKKNADLADLEVRHFDEECRDSVDRLVTYIVETIKKKKR
jgi:hypothetical protein